METLAAGSKTSEPVRDRSRKGGALSRERVLQCAVAVADAGGIGSLTIRSLAHHLGVKPMSVYYYVANKDEILDGIVDLVFSEIDLPSPGGDWQSEMRRRAISARDVLSRHRWAIGLLGSRNTPGPATLRHHDATIGTLRAAGFTVEMTAHAYALIDSYVYGFALQEAALPFKGPATAGEVAEPTMQQFPADEYPHLVEMATEYILRPGYDFGNEFEVGLTVIFDALTRSTSDQDSGPSSDLSNSAGRRKTDPHHGRRRSRALDRP
jgi:AcrR family transcriptional regulator